MKDVIIWILLITIFFLIIKQSKREKKAKKYYDISKQELKELFYTSEEMLQELDDLSGELLKSLDVKYKEINAVLQQVQKYSSNETDSPGKNLAVYDLQVKKSDSDILLTDKHAKVRELDTKGYDLTHIAKTLNMGKGEVKLILNMKETV